MRAILRRRADTNGLPPTPTPTVPTPTVPTPTAPTPTVPTPTVLTPSAASPDLLGQRERLTEQFAVLQSELGGLFYEMAIRDHVRMDVLIPKAAALQRVDAELAQVERMLETGGSAAGGTCPSCDAIYARGAAFCAQCAHPLTQP